MALLFVTFMRYIFHCTLGGACAGIGNSNAEPCD